jgi:oligoendopeptidase F
MLKRRFIIYILFLLSVLNACVTKPALEETHKEIPAQFKWNLASIFETEALWEANAKLLEEELIPRITAFRGTLDNKENTLACLKAYTEAKMALERIFVYAKLYFHRDMSDPHAQVLNGRSDFLNQQLNEAATFINPELARKDDAVLRAYMAEPDFLEYRNLIYYIVRNKPHILSIEESAIIALATMFMESPQDIYSMFINNVYSHSEIIDDSRFIFIDDEEKKFNDTFAAILAAEVNKNIFWARAHNHNSALEASLNPNIPLSVFENLISSANKGLASKHRFDRLVDEFDELFYNSRISKEIEKISDYWHNISFEMAVEITLSALKPLGEEYGRVLDTAFNNNWIDVFPMPNKRSGAYCDHLYRPHPFILMNYDNTFGGVTALVHELGHAVHIYSSSLTQPYNDYEPDSFTSEVAAALNEILLLRHKIDNAETNVEKIYFMAWLLDLYANRFFTQVKNAEFEKQIHEWVEAGYTLNAAALNSIWLNLHRKYSGDDNEHNSILQYLWARIPHFYYNFYVYQYATSLAAANALAFGILENRPGALDSYLEFLHSGSKYDPITTLAKLGLDMTSPRIFDDFIMEYEYLINEMEQFIRKEAHR